MSLRGRYGPRAVSADGRLDIAPWVGHRIRLSGAAAPLRTVIDPGKL